MRANALDSPHWRSFLLAAAATDMTIYLQACKNLEQEHTHMHKHLYSEGMPTVQNVNIKMSQGHI